MKLTTLLILLLLATPVGATVPVRDTEIPAVAYKICAEIAIELQRAVDEGFLTEAAADHVNGNCLDSNFSDYEL